VAFVLTLVAASRPDSDIFKNAARRIQRARKKDRKLIQKLMKMEILLQIEMMMMMEALKSFMLICLVSLKTCCKCWRCYWYKTGHPFSLKTCKEKEEVMNAIHIMMW